MCHTQNGIQFKPPICQFMEQIRITLRCLKGPKKTHSTFEHLPVLELFNDVLCVFVSQRAAKLRTIKVFATSYFAILCDESLAHQEPCV